MTTADKKQAIKNHCIELLTDAAPHVLKLIDKAINSSAIDADSWEPDSNPMIIPKNILQAVFEATADQYSLSGTSFARESRKTVKNLKYFL